MSTKRKSQRKQSLQMQKPSSSLSALVNPATGLRNDEIAFGIDPKEPGKVKNYIMPDGRVLNPGDKGAPQGIPSIIHPDLIVTSSSIKETRTTLASRLGEMLIIAEDLFGKRDRTYTFLGIEFTAAEPHIHFEANKSLIMRLHLSALLEPMEAYKQMTHECIHMLSPCPQKPVTILEEGMAEVWKSVV